MSPKIFKKISHLEMEMIPYLYKTSNFYERNKLYLPKENSLVKAHLNKLKEYVDMEGMEIQLKKTCI